MANNDDKRRWTDQEAILLEHQKELGLILGQLPTIFNNQDELFKKVNIINDTLIRNESTVNNIYNTLNHGKFDKINDKLENIVNRIGAIENRIDGVDKAIKRYHGESSKIGIIGFIEKSWQQFLDHIGWLSILLFIYIMLCALKSQPFIDVLKNIF